MACARDNDMVAASLRQNSLQGDQPKIDKQLPTPKNWNLRSVIVASLGIFIAFSTKLYHNVLKHFI